MPPSLDLLFVPARESGDKRRAFRWEPEKRGTFERAEGSARPGQGEAGIQVDGVERDMSQIDPNEIESITVLKDASATAVFGVPEYPRSLGPAHQSGAA
mgnify:CR=1 FL=1